MDGTRILNYLDTVADYQEAACGFYTSPHYLHSWWKFALLEEFGSRGFPLEFPKGPFTLSHSTDACGDRNSEVHFLTSSVHTIVLHIYLKVGGQKKAGVEGSCKTYTTWDIFKKL